jgi:hypothetical protein
MPCPMAAKKAAAQLHARFRPVLVEWLIEWAEHFCFNQATLHKAIALLDRCLGCKTVARPYLQLLGAACLRLAAKHEKQQPDAVRCISNLVPLTAGRRLDITAMERKVCLSFPCMLFM